MIEKYKNLGNGAMLVGIGAFGLAAYLRQGSTTQNIWDAGGAPPWLGYLGGLCIIMAFWAYARSKGRSGWLGLLLPLLSIVGLIILLLLEDHSDRLPEVECSKCGGKNLGEDTECRYCKSSLLGAAA